MTGSSRRALCRLTHLVASAILVSVPVHAQDQPVDRARDRGDGVPVSIFGTYIRPREIVVYPFFEYYRASRKTMP